jgi:putative Mg2+ transporter-C (MgtC) family protein
MTGLDGVAIGKLLLAVLLGGVVGAERQIHGRPAGLRTHILVCLGSALIIVVGHSLGPNIDPGRAVAGIVTGIGFLGAGVIVKSHDVVRGLTTAACIWFVAALGIAVGQGLYVVSVGAMVIGLAVLTLLAWLAHRLPSVSYHTAIVRSEGSDADGLVESCREALSKRGYRVVGIAAHLDKAGNQIELTLRLRSRSGNKGLEVGRMLLAIPDVQDVVWD